MALWWPRRGAPAAAVCVEVADAENRLLHVEDVPRRESKYLIRALRA